MKTFRFSYLAGFAAREREREAKPVKTRKSGARPLFRHHQRAAYAARHVGLYQLLLIAYQPSFAPHSVQNFAPSASLAPHCGQKADFAASAAGFFEPQLGQNAMLPALVAPQEHFHEPSAGCGAGFFEPQLGQKPMLSALVAPQEHFQPPCCCC